MAALHSVLPWDLAQLRDDAKLGIVEADRKYGPSLGTSFDKFAWDYVRQAAAAAGERLRVQHDDEERQGERQQPPDESVREALETFSVQEWRELIGEFGRWDVDALRSYLDANKEPLKSWLGERKFYRVFNEAVKRGMILFLSQPLRMTAPSDAFWAAFIHNDATRRNIRGEPRPSRKRSWSEVKGLNNISESLTDQWHKVSPYQVKMMLARMEQTPFEEFDGDPDDYLLWVTDPIAYKRHLRLRVVATRPQRNPDPYFSHGG